ncbi:hypothetical protein ACFL35_00370 [Candidatus Riflebacteria bacterium]
MKHWIYLYILLSMAFFNQGCKKAHTDSAGVTTLGESFDPEESGMVEFDVTGELDGNEAAKVRSVRGVKFDVLSYKGNWQFLQTGAFSNMNAYSNASGSTVIFKAAFARFGIVFQPSTSYQNPGIVNFKLDGIEQGSLDLSSYNPFPGTVSPYVISVADGHIEHSVEMILATGSVSIIGFQASYVLSGGSR